MLALRRDVDRPFTHSFTEVIGDGCDCVVDREFVHRVLDVFAAVSEPLVSGGAPQECLAMENPRQRDNS